jgi:hypothetical protein
MHEREGSEQYRLLRLADELRRRGFRAALNPSGAKGSIDSLS